MPYLFPPQIITPHVPCHLSTCPPLCLFPGICSSPILLSPFLLFTIPLLSITSDLMCPCVCSPREKLLTQDLYLVPYALLEMALLQILSSRWQEARNTLDKARSASPVHTGWAVPLIPGHHVCVECYVK